MWQIYGEKGTCGTKGGLISGWKQSMKSVSNNEWQEVSRSHSVRLESRYLNCDKFTTTSVCSIPTAQCQVSDERYGAAGQCAKKQKPHLF